MATTAWATDPASESQLSYIHDLAQKHEISDEQAAFIAKVDAGERKLNKGEAHRIIDGLRECPRKSVSRDWPEIPPGRYAVVDPMDDVLKFYLVNKPVEGKWAGFTFLNVYASEELYPIKNKEHKKAIMTEIAKDPEAASVRYGMETRNCGVCGRKLTRKESRERGIGPICAAKQGW
jgi:uncharacterized protein (DUF2141 family)